MPRRSNEVVRRTKGAVIIITHAGLIEAGEHGLIFQLPGMAALHSGLRFDELTPPRRVSEEQTGRQTTGASVALPKSLKKRVDPMLKAFSLSGSTGTSTKLFASFARLTSKKKQQITNEVLGFLVLNLNEVLKVTKDVDWFNVRRFCSNLTPPLVRFNKMWWKPISSHVRLTSCVIFK